MKNENVKKYTIIGLLSLIVIAVIGVAYAYFGLEVEGTGKDIVMDTGDLRLEYMDDQELSLVGATPGDSISKTITVKNVGTRKVAYTLYWGDLINTIENFELHITMECKSYINYGTDTQEESGTCDRIYRAVPMSDTVTSGTIKNNISIDVGMTHEYNLTVSFDNKTYEQNNNKNKKFTGKIGIEEYKAPEPVYCTYDGTVTDGVEFEKGPYTYKYGQEGNASGWIQIRGTNSFGYGWGVILTDKDSTDVVTEAPCTYINDIPIVSMSYMFYTSNSALIDTSNFDTSNVIHMNGMFYFSKATEIKGLENFDTGNVTDMSELFRNSSITTLNVSSFDTGKVTNMRSMFEYINIPFIDLSSFDTSKVTNMDYMFRDTLNTKAMDLTSFNTSSVTSMGCMFEAASVLKLDLSSFDTSNVTSMKYMFTGSNITNLNLNNFNTSNVTNMNSMFNGSKTVSLDINSFDTSNVTDMSNLFSGINVDKIIGLDNLNTSNVTDMSSMFYSINIKNLNLSNFDTSKVTKMNSMFSHADVTELKGFDKLNTSKVTSMSYMFYYSKLNIIDVSSFDTSNVTNMNSMFMGTEANEINGLYNFDTSNVVSMNAMFYVAKNLKLLDLSSFDTSKVTDMNSMFAGCTNLETIYASSNFVTSSVTSSSSLFSSSTKLVGGVGTEWNSDNTGLEYARIDGGTDAPGYFTLKNN